jgi:hypothetical protein
VCGAVASWCSPNIRKLLLAVAASLGAGLVTTLWRVGRLAVRPLVVDYWFQALIQMATCPRCGGFLNEHHRCVGLWRLRLRAWGAVLLGGIVGGLAGLLLLSGFNREASWLSITVAALLGMIIMVATRTSNNLR